MNRFNPEVCAFIRRGQVFKADTVKGGTAHLRCLGSLYNRDRDGKGIDQVQAVPGTMVYLVYAGLDKRTDKPRVIKQRFEVIHDAIEAGDLKPLREDEYDKEVFSAASAGLSALGKGMNLDEYLDKLATGEVKENVNGN